MGALRCFLLGLGVLLLAVAAAPAWGPHTEITAAALAVVPERARWQKYFGPHWQRLARDYCWMADWQEAMRPDHYADDYLLFPGYRTHLTHMLPTVRQTYEPFFRRALQAVRTESPENAARWIGSLLHFVQDSGSPPHTTGIGGALHGKMERWVDESKITLGGYSPCLLGATEDEALRGFRKRMDGLVDYARIRAVQLKPLVEKLAERVNQPLELECALETARVTADLVHTLCTLGLTEPTGPGCTLEGKLAVAPPVGYATVPAKVLLAGTNYSTTTDTDGHYRFRNLPAGRYAVWFLATGYETEQVADVLLEVGKATRLAPPLRPDPVAGNLVRNPRFAVRWLRPDQPDGWTRDPLKPGRWASAVIRVPHAQKCAVRLDWLPGVHVPVSVRWRANPSSAAEGREAPLPPAGEVVPDPRLTPFEKGVFFLEVLLHTDEPLEKVCRHVAVKFLPMSGGP